MLECVTQPLQLVPIQTKRTVLPAMTILHALRRTLAKQEFAPVPTQLFALHVIAKLPSATQPPEHVTFLSCPMEVLAVMETTALW
jgi:hypothetical protein